MPDTTIADLAQRLQMKAVPHNTTWTPANLLQIPATFETDISDSITGGDVTNNGNITSEENPISGDLSSHQHSQLAPDAAGTNQTHSAGISSKNLHKTVFAHGPPGPYGELPRSWRAPASLKINKVNNTELGEYLIGIGAKIVCPIEYWMEGGQGGVDHSSHGSDLWRKGQRWSQIQMRASTLATPICT